MAVEIQRPLRDKYVNRLRLTADTGRQAPDSFLSTLTRRTTYFNFFRATCAYVVRAFRTVFYRGHNLTISMFAESFIGVIG